MSTLIIETTQDLPSAAVVATAEQHLADVTGKLRAAQEHFSSLMSQQAALEQEQGRIQAQRLSLEQDQQRLDQQLQQAETDALLAASSPVKSATANARLKELRKSKQQSDSSRHKTLKERDSRSAAILVELDTIRTASERAQEAIRDNQRQEQLIHTSLQNARSALGQEIYDMRSARLTTLKATVDGLAAQLVDAQVAYATEGEATYAALSNYSELRNQAAREYSLIEDETIRVFKAYLAWCDVLLAESPKIVTHVGPYSLARELAMNEHELIVTIHNQERKLVQSKQDAAKMLLAQYLASK